MLQSKEVLESRNETVEPRVHNLHLPGRLQVHADREVG